MSKSLEEPIFKIKPKLWVLHYCIKDYVSYKVLNQKM